MVNYWDSSDAWMLKGVTGKIHAFISVRGVFGALSMASVKASVACV